MINIDLEILHARKNRDAVSVSVYQTIKNEIMLYKTAQKAKPYDEVVELGIINKLIKERKSAIPVYAKNLEDRKNELSEEDIKRKEAQISQMEDELAKLQTLLPAPPSEQEIENFIRLWTDRTPMCNEFGEIQIPKKLMGAAIKATKMEFPAADGKIISSIINKYIK